MPDRNFWVKGCTVGGLTFCICMVVGKIGPYLEKKNKMKYMKDMYLATNDRAKDEIRKNGKVSDETNDLFNSIQRKM